MTTNEDNRGQIDGENILAIERSGFRATLPKVLWEEFTVAAMVAEQNKTSGVISALSTYNSQHVHQVEYFIRDAIRKFECDRNTVKLKVLGLAKRQAQSEGATTSLESQIDGQEWLSLEKVSIRLTTPRQLWIRFLITAMVVCQSKNSGFEAALSAYTSEHQMLVRYYIEEAMTRYSIATEQEVKAHILGLADSQAQAKSSR